MRLCIQVLAVKKNENFNLNMVTSIPEGCFSALNLDNKRFPSGEISLFFEVVNVFILKRVR